MMIWPRRLTTELEGLGQKALCWGHAAISVVSWMVIISEKCSGGRRQAWEEAPIHDCLGPSPDYGAIACLRSQPESHLMYLGIECRLNFHAVSVGKGHAAKYIEFFMI